MCFVFAECWLCVNPVFSFSSKMILWALLFNARWTICWHCTHYSPFFLPSRLFLIVRDSKSLRLVSVVSCFAQRLSYEFGDFRNPVCAVFRRIFDDFVKHVCVVSLICVSERNWGLANSFFDRGIDRLLCWELIDHWYWRFIEKIFQLRKCCFGIWRVYWCCFLWMKQQNQTLFHLMKFSFLSAEVESNI